MLARLLTITNHVQACIFLRFDPQQRGIRLGLLEFLACCPPLRSELVGF